MIWVKSHVPIVDDKHYQLCEGAEKVDQLRNAIVLVINTGKINHIEIVDTFNAIEERYCGSLLFSSTSFNCLRNFSNIEIKQA